MLILVLCVMRTIVGIMLSIENCWNFLLCVYISNIFELWTAEDVIILLKVNISEVMRAN